MIPESTLDLFIRRFDMLHDQFDEIKTCMRRNDVMSDHFSSPAPAACEMQSDLVKRISALQELVMKQTSQLEELRIDRQLLLEENKLVKEQINSLSVDLSALRHRTSLVNDFTTHALANHEFPGVNAAECRDEESEMVISCGVRCGNTNLPPEDFSFAVLSTVLPSSMKSDIKAVKVLSPNSSAPGSLTLENELPVTSDNAQRSEFIDGPRSIFSLLVRLSSEELLTQIFKEKRNLTSFSLMDLNSSLLGDISITNLSKSNILCKDNFKYVWHRGGKFLTKKLVNYKYYMYSANLRKVRKMYLSA